MCSKMGVDVEIEPVKVSLGFYEMEEVENVSSSTSISSLDYKHFPCLILYDEYNCYTLPSFEYPRHLKMGHHGGPPVDLENRNFTPDEEKMTIVSDALKRFMPGVKNTASITDTCMYSLSKDHDFIVDVHPSYPNIVIGAGFSGHGFKFGSVVGKIISELMLKGETSHDISHFALGRFY